MNKWQTLSEETVYDAPLFKVKKKEFRLPNGDSRSYSIVERDDTVVIFPFDEQDNIYLIKQYRYLFDAIVLESIAGFVEKGEDALSAAKRELKEEVGITAKDWRKLTEIEGAASVVKMKAHLFLARSLSFEKASPTDSEQIEMVKMPLSEAVEKVVDGEIQASATIAGILLIDTLIKKGKL